MRKLIFAFIILLLAVWVGFLIHKDSGYILISYANWSIETSLWVAIIALIIAFLLIYCVIRLLKNIGSLGTKFQRWGTNRNHQKSRHLTNQGLCELAEGHWQSAEASLVKAAKASAAPLINYLSAARAAHAQQAYDRRDNYLRQAHRSTKGSEIAVGLTQAQLQIDGEQWEQAIATLKHLNQMTPNHVYILNLLKQVYLEVGDWKNLQPLLGKLRKSRSLSEMEVTNLEQQSYLGLLETAIKTATPEKVAEIWQQFPKASKLQPTLVACYVRYLLKQNQMDLAATLIEAAIKKHWDVELVNLYGLAKSTRSQKQLTTAESWLKKHSQEPSLSLCLGRLCIHQQLWGKAKAYLQQSIALKATPAAHLELGCVLEALGESAMASQTYAQGIHLIDQP